MRFRSTHASNEGGFEPFEKAPRGAGRRGAEERGDQRKVHQLCAQVREIVGFALAEQWMDPILERLSVVSVTPAPDASRLLITVVADAEGEPLKAEDVLDALKAVRGELRHEIASEIHRKKTPELAFDLAPSWSAGISGEPGVGPGDGPPQPES